MVREGNTQSFLAVIDQQVSMASIASVDKTLSRMSLWMSSVAFAGVLALAFLPGREGPAIKTASPAARPASVAPPTKAAAPQSSSIANVAPPVPPSAPVAAPVPPAAAAPPPSAPPPAPAAAATPPAITTPPPPDVWTPEEMAAGLRQCVQLLAPVSADVAMEEPMKHGQCGTPAPLALRSAGGKDKVEFAPAPTMNCR